MAEKLRRKFLSLSKNEQVIVKAIVLVVAVVLVSVPFAYAGNITNWGYGYKTGAYGYGYSGYSTNVPAAPSSLSCNTTTGVCTWVAPTTTRGGDAISAGPFGGGSVASYLIDFDTSAITSCADGTSVTDPAAELQSLASSTLYYVAVCAVDNNGNRGVVATTSFTAAAVGSSSSSSGGGGGSTTTAAPTSPVPTVVSPGASSSNPGGVSNNVDFGFEAASVTVAPAARDMAMEKSYEARAKTVLGSSNSSVVNFVTYGTPSTMILGAGERLGVLNSYRAAYGKVPTTDAQWSDVIKIANGRWPSETSAKAETRAKATFKTIYKRDAVMTQANDNAAVTVMAYGLRPANRNLNSEKVAIKNFRGTLGRSPSLATDWDMVRAIAYSGAKR